MAAPVTSSDAEHREVIETLLAMAEAEHRWGDSPRALHLLNQVEVIVGRLPESHRRLRVRCRHEVDRLALA